MPYPIVDGAYGYKPINLIGGQVFSGSTREYRIAYNYNTNIFYGDPVTLSSGFINLAYTASSNQIDTTRTVVGIFLGCSFTDPVTKQKRFSQFYPASTLAGDIQAIVADDPDACFRMAVMTTATATTIGSMSQQMVGLNVSATQLAGNAATGNSLLGALTAVANVSGGAWRVLQLVPDTQINTSCTYSSGTGSTSIVVSGLTIGQVIPSSTDMFQLVPATGQLQWVGTTSGALTVSSATAQTVTMAANTTVAGPSLVLVQSQEIICKLNFSVHRYYVA
jgi:hypothetical protein